jgi:Ni/Fe-hydrogenase subunit HybB-like protein
MTENEIKLPYKIGQFSSRWFLIIGLLLALVVVGGYAYFQQFTEGEVVTGLRNIGSMNGVTWGLYVAMYIYLMGLSFAGITFAVLVRLFKVELLKPVARMAEALTVFAIISGALLTIVDVGKPIRALVNLWKYARPQSPFFGTFTLVIAGYLFASVVYLYLDGRKDAAEMAAKSGKFNRFYSLWAAGYTNTDIEKERHEKASFWLSVAIVPLMVAATSTLGFVFGLQAGRPGWFGALQAPGFVILASLSGLGMLVLIVAILRKSLGLEKQLGKEIFVLLGNLMMILNIIYVYFTVVEWLSSFYSAHLVEIRISQALINGEYSTLFWATIILLILPMSLLVGQFITKRYSLSVIILSALMVNLAAIGKRYLIVVPSQTHGTLLPYGIGSYSPTWVEYAVVIGLIAFATLLYALFVKVFPIIGVPSMKGEA